MLALLVCLVGFSCNASAIHVGGEAVGGEAAHGAASAVAERFVRRAAAAVGEAATAGSESAEAVSHGGPQHAVVAATAFFLVAKLLRSESHRGFLQRLKLTLRAVQSSHTYATAF